MDLKTTIRHGRGITLVTALILTTAAGAQPEDPLAPPEPSPPVAVPGPSPPSRESVATRDGLPAAGFRARQQITAIDLLLEWQPTAAYRMTSDRQVPKALQPADLEILYGGRPRTVVGVEDLGGALDASDRPWQLVIYFDRVLARAYGLRWAAAALAERAALLTAAGSVEVVVADPWPRRLLEPTRDAGRLHSALSEIVLFSSGHERLVALRAEFLAELEDGLGGTAAEELGVLLASEEARIVRSQQAGLLSWLAARPRSSDAARARQALLLVHAGYDREPEHFYATAVAQVAAGEEVAVPLPSPTAASLAADSQVMAQTVAAYGWVAFSLAPPPIRPAEGVKLSKWDASPLEPRLAEPEGRNPFDDPVDKYTERNALRDDGKVLMPGIRLKLVEHRKPARAEAYLELGRELLEQGKIADAEDALRRAVYHFADGRKTASRQAGALIELGRVLDRRQQDAEARLAFQRARQLDAGLAFAELGPASGLREPLAPLAELARATAGRVVRDPQALDEALASLARRLRVTYQVSGPPDGELHPVEVRVDAAGFDLAHPRWARSSTPESVAEARLCRLLDSAGRPGESPAGSLGLAASVRWPAGSSPELELRLPAQDVPAATDAEEVPETVLRVSVGFGDGEGCAGGLRHRLVTGPGRMKEPAGPEWVYGTALDLPEDPVWLAVLVEDLAGGTWGARLLALDEVR